MSHGAIPGTVANRTRISLYPLAQRLTTMGISANVVTVLGGVLTIVAGALIAAAMPLAATIVLAIGALADTLDGQLAKAAGGGTRLGAFLDSTVDRIADGSVFIGTAILGLGIGQPQLVWWALVAFLASSLVPYIRAKAESLGADARVGPAPREARVVIFILGLAAWAITGLDSFFVAAVLAVALLAAITAVMRVVYVSRQLSMKGSR